MVDVAVGPSIHEQAVFAIPSAIISRVDRIEAYLLAVVIDLVVVWRIVIELAFRFTTLVELGRHVVTVAVLRGKRAVQKDAAGAYADREARSLYSGWSQTVSAMAPW